MRSSNETRNREARQHIIDVLAGATWDCVSRDQDATDAVVDFTANLTSHQRDLINDLNLEADLHDLEAQAAAMAEQDLEYAAAYGEAPTFAFISEAVDAARAAYFRRKLGA